ncbi:MAG TPA: AMP-binding protein, partial [Solirubrobacterales bacterium]|nr:AMP-binding protein [Solirubrobacterales bacterium]HNK35357.1 AMP-binding protein [Solirubrobacterales bacterium]
MSPEPLWSPDPEAIESSQLVAWAHWLKDRDLGPGTAEYADLWQWSTDQPEEFWRSIWDYFEVLHDGEPAAVLSGHEMPGARWFEGTSLNYAEHIFRDRDPEAAAVFAASEVRALETVTWGELRSRVADCAAGLKALGVGPGDRVAGYLPNSHETIVAFLAVASLGAVWSSCSPDFGAGAVTDRLAQIEPRVLLAVDGYNYGGKGFDRRGVVSDLVAGMPTVEQVVILPYLEPDPDLTPLPGAITWNELLSKDPGAELTFTRVPFDSPLWILYSSGTTGLPKPIVQS